MPMINFNNAPLVSTADLRSLLPDRADSRRLLRPPAHAGTFDWGSAFAPQLRYAWCLPDHLVAALRERDGERVPRSLTDRHVHVDAAEAPSGPPLCDDFDRRIKPSPTTKMDDVRRVS